jgi:hypothetical protein
MNASAFHGGFRLTADMNGTDRHQELLKDQ